MDESILWMTQQITGTPVLDFIMITFSRLGNNGFIWCLITVILLIFPKTRKSGLICAVALLLSLLFCNAILKNLIARPRPYDVLDWLSPLMPPLPDYSFPSGHASASFAAATALFFSDIRRPQVIAVFVLATLISLSRIYVGMHYPSDVLGGLITGMLCGYLAHSIQMYAEKSKRIRKQDKK